MFRHFRRFATRPKVTIYDKRWCGLCDEAKMALAEIQKKRVDIEHGENKRKFIQYTYDVPVIHINGQEAMRHRVDKEKFMKLLAASVSSGTDETIESEASIDNKTS